MKKLALFAFRGGEMCFVHVLLNALAHHEAGWEVRVVLEGEAVKLIPDLVGQGPLVGLFRRCREANLVAGVCLACSKKLGTAEAAREQGLELLDDMNGHAGMLPFSRDGYAIVSF
jgi:hypothetical protein